MLKPYPPVWLYLVKEITVEWDHKDDLIGLVSL